MDKAIFGRKVTSIMLHAVFWGITLVITLPVWWILILSFKDNNSLYNNILSLPLVWNLDNYIRSFNTINLGQLYMNTFLVMMVSVGIAITITFMSSCAISHLSGRKIIKNLYTYLLLGLMIPPFILLFPVFRIGVLLNLYRTRWPLILAYIATNISFDILLFTNFLKSIPSEIEEAALIDNCNLFQLITRVIVPIAKPVITTVFIFNVLYVWNEFPFASVLLPKVTMYTLSLGASFFKGLYSIDYTGIIASSVIIIIPQLIFYGFFQKYIVDGITTGAVKG